MQAELAGSAGSSSAALQAGAARGSAHAPLNSHCFFYAGRTRARPLARVQVLGTALLWGAGTAAGEIPPYALSYHAAKAGKRNAEVDRLLGVEQEASDSSAGAGAAAWHVCCSPGARP